MFGVIDIGTNSTRLLIASRSGRGITIEETGLITTRLGQGIGGCKLLDEAMERTIKALHVFNKQAHGWGVNRIIAAATSAVRDAVNGPDFVKEVLRRTGLEIKVLTGSEEAAYSYRGVVGGLDSYPQQALVVDIGGGSTEFIWAVEGEIIFRSVQAGAVRMTEAMSSDEVMAGVLAPVLKEVGRSKLKNLVGVGGTVTTLGAMDRQLTVYDPALIHGHIVSLNRVDELLGMLQGCDLEARKQIPGLQAARADIIIAGVKLVKIIMNRLQVPFLMISETDVLYGLALELASQD
ncbi:MAG: Ppx/GppA family phosphatase [Bacillota bacterium]|jgi:exopolyphosphatase/guanosine-5'-triphosphate,3'-diphosphate pyrophosphatase